MYNTFALCIVTYYPNEDIYTRIKDYLEFGNTIYVWDNTPNGDTIFHNHKENNLVILGTGINVGIGFALNKLLNQIHSDGFRLALYFDQDTLFTVKSLQWIQNWSSHNEATIKDTAVLNFKPNISENEIEQFELRTVYLVISSCSLFNLEIIRKIGWHNPKLFLECVDYELCARAHFSHFKISLVSGCPGLDHDKLQPNNSVSILNRKFKYRQYSINRNFSFTYNLLKLSLQSLFKGYLMLSWCFLRNVITHLLSQTRASLFTAINLLTVRKS